MGYGHTVSSNLPMTGTDVVVYMIVAVLIIAAGVAMFVWGTE